MATKRLRNPGPLRPADLVYPERREAIAAGSCMGCEVTDLGIDDFTSNKSIAEYRISGFCEMCQDKIFGKGYP